jgi:hypothetical protein
VNEILADQLPVSLTLGMLAICSSRAGSAFSRA